MDAEKLLRILNDLIGEDGELGLQNKINEITNSVSQNNPEGFKAAQGQLTELTKAVSEQSVSHGFSRTEQLLLEKIGGENYFGKGLLRKFDDLFALRGFEIQQQLNAFKDERAQFLEKIQKLVGGLTEVGLEEYRPKLYEVGLVLPAEQGELDTLPDRMRELKLLLAAFAEATGTEKKSLKIDRASSGSIELFSLQPAEVALLLSSLFLNISNIWDKIAKLRKKSAELSKEQGYTDAYRKDIRSAIEKETERIKKEVLEELPEEIMKSASKKLEDGRKNEIKNQIRISLRAIFQWFEVGAEVDITPVRVDKGQEENPKEVKNIASVQQANQGLSQIYRLPPQDRKALFELTDGEEGQDNEGKPQNSADDKKGRDLQQ